MTPAEVNVRLLLAVAVVVVAVHVVGRVAARAGQPKVIGEVVAGILLGPSLLGLVAPGMFAYLFPDPVIVGLQILSQLGLALFMFLVGLHLDIPSVRDNSRTVAIVAPAAVVVPFALAVGLAVVIHPAFGGAVDLVVFALFLGSATAVTALPVLARILIEVGLSRHRVGSTALACAALNDVVAWCLVALVAAVNGTGGPAGALTTMGLAVAFLATMFLVVRPLLGRLPDLPISVVLAFVLCCAWAGEQIGIHAIIGAFAAGVVMPRREGWLRTIDERLDVVVRSLLLPIFFVVAGLVTRVDQLTWPALVLTLVIIVVATAGKFGAASVAARIAGEPWRDSVTLGILMNTRGLTELVILSLGLQLGIIDTTLYTIMVLMALVTTLMAAPLLTIVRRSRPGTIHRPGHGGSLSGRRVAGAPQDPD